MSEPSASRAYAEAINYTVYRLLLARCGVLHATVYPPLAAGAL